MSVSAHLKHTSHETRDVCIGSNNASGKSYREKLNSRFTFNMLSPYFLRQKKKRPWRRMGEWMHRSTFYWSRHYLEVSAQLHAPATLPPGERAPGTHWIGGWVGPRTRMDDVERRKILFLPGQVLRRLSRPARRQSLYRLSYPGSTSYANGR
jgi:hypothetical protein